MRHVLVVHGPATPLDRRGLLADAPRTLERLAERCRDWGAALGLAVDVVGGADEAAVARTILDSEADGLVLGLGAPGAGSPALAELVHAAGLPAVCVVQRDLRRQGANPRAAVVGLACARLIHGRGVDGYRWALHHLAWAGAWPPTTRSYGPEPDQEADLRIPEGDGHHPVVVLLHGGFWWDTWERDLMDGLAVDLARRGFATWNVEYRRVGGGGGWPVTGADVAAAVDHLAVLARDDPLDTGRVTVLGHSAGGQLALWAAARGRRRDSLVVPERVVALAAVSDLASAAEAKVGGAAVDAYLPGGDRRAAALGEASPLLLVPLGVPTVLVHAADDSLLPVEQSRRYAEAARRAGDEVDELELEAGGHFGLIDPASAAWAATADRLCGPEGYAARRDSLPR